MTHEAEVTETKTPKPRMKFSAIIIVVGSVVVAIFDGMAYPRVDSGLQFSNFPH